MDIAHGRVDAVVTQQTLQLIYRHTGLELMGGVGMAQTVDAADFIHPGLTLSPGKGFLRGRYAHRGAPVAPVKQPCPRMIVLPISS